MSETLRITVNGAPRDIPVGATVADLLDILEMSRERIAVERNRDVVRRVEWSETSIVDGDVFEIVHFVGGG